MKNVFLKVISTALLIAFTSCGGSSGSDSSIPKITKISDGWTEIKDEQTGVNPTTFTIIFDKAMDKTSIETDGNITMNCDGLEPKMTKTLDSTKTIVTITVEDAYKYQLLECTAVFTNKIKDTDGNTMEEIEYTFTNACALSDDFNSITGFDTPTGTCWTVMKKIIGQDTSYTNWNSLLNIMTGIAKFNTEESGFDINTENVNIDIFQAITKLVAIDSEVVTLEICLDNITNLTTSGDALWLFIIPKSQEASGLYVFGVAEGGGEKICALSHPGGYDPSWIECPENNYCFKVSFEKNKWLSLKYKAIDDASWTNLSAGEIPPPSFNEGDEVYIGLSITSNFTDKKPDKASIQYIKMNGVTLENQY